MARPTRATVDYFPHLCDHGKTMFIIEQLYGNDGYAFWFKLLELIGRSDGHVFMGRNPSDWEFLLAKTHFSSERCVEILDKLAVLGAIDKDLWDSERIVWSQNFVNNVADVYKNRKRPLPQKPLLQVETTAQDDNYPVSTGRNSPEEGLSVQPTDKNTQSKLKETKVKETKLTNRAREGEQENNVGEGEPIEKRLDGSELYPSGNGGEETPSPAENNGSVESESSAPGFLEFWNAYPRRSGMNLAIPAFDQLLADGVDPTDLVAAAKKYGVKVLKDGLAEKFIKMPHTFLTAGVFVEYAPMYLASCQRCHGGGYHEQVRDDGSTAMAPCSCTRRFDKFKHMEASG